MSRPAEALASAYRRVFSARNLAALAVVPALLAAAHLVIVRPGDTLSAIAQRACHSPADWTGIWAASHKHHLIGSNPDLIYPGQRVVISCRTASVPSRAADTAYRPVTSSRDGDGDFDNDTSDAAPAYAAPPAPSSSTGSSSAAPSGGTWMQHCIKMAEEGGSYAWGPGNGGGAYQFLYSTWVKYGGAPGMYGSAGPAYQDQIFWNAVAQNGYNDWAPYDGC